MAKGKKTYKKRVVVLILILVLAIVSIGVPIVSSLKLLEEHIDIGVDILGVADLFADGFSFDIIKDNISVWVLGVYMLVALILVLKGLFALLVRGKKRFGLAAIITLLLGVVFILAEFDFDFELIGELAGEPKLLAETIDYGVYAMVGAPLLILILSLFTYKKKN